MTFSFAYSTLERRYIFLSDFLLLESVFSGIITKTKLRTFLALESSSACRFTIPLFSSLLS
jgi:hypothetical protein